MHLRMHKNLIFIYAFQIFKLHIILLAYGLLNCLYYFIYLQYLCHFLPKLQIDNSFPTMLSNVFPAISFEAFNKATGLFDNSVKYSNIRI